jgi:hypothetical protein
MALLVIACLSLQSPAFFSEDDALYFNSVNNIANVHPLYFYYGYVQFIPQGAAYLLRFFPFVAQAVLYRIIPLAILVILYWDTKRLLCLRCNTTEAAFLSIAVILYIRFIEAFISAFLAFSIWSALLAAFVYVVSMSIDSRSYSFLAIVGVLLGTLSHPLGILLSPLLIISAAWPNANARNVDRAISIGIALAILISSAGQYLIAGQHYRGTMVDLPAVYSAVALGFRHEHKLQVVLMIVSLVVLVAVLITTAWKAICRGDPIDVRLNGMLTYFGISSVVFYIVSPRFLDWLLQHAGAAFQPRYILVVCFCAFLAIIWRIISLPRSDARPVLIGSVFGFCLALATTAIYPSVTGPFIAALHKYRFLLAAADFRKLCSPEEVLIYEVAWSSPVIFCKKREFAEGFTPVTQFKFKVWEHSPKKSSPDDYGPPGIYSGTFVKP